jgi:hypothetical protein
MALYFKDRIPNAFSGQNARFYDAVANNGSVKLSDFKLVLKNTVPADRQGDPVSAGNMNFASGNAEIPLAAGQSISRGKIVTISQNGAAPANIQREIKATGQSFSIRAWFKLANDKILLIYGGTSHSAVVAEINWQNKTVTFGTSVSIMDSYRIELVNSSAFCCAAANSSNTSATLYFYKISGTSITAAANYNLTGGTLSHSVSMSNPVKTGANTVVIAHEMYNSADSYFAYEYTISSSGTSVTKGRLMASIPRNNGNISIIGLYSVNQGGGKNILITRNISSNDYYAEPVGISGAGRFSLGSSYYYNVINACGAAKYSMLDHKLLLVYSSLIGSVNRQYITVLSVNPSNGAISKGTAYQTPAYNFTGVFLDSKGSIIMPGTAYRNEACENILLDSSISGTSFSFTEFQPFQDFGRPSGSLSYGNMYNQYDHFAFENADNPDEYLFMFSQTVSSTSPAQFWFGNKTDSVKSSNTAGIALENSSGGYVRTQISGKLITGLWSGLKRGTLYSAGANGGLTEYSGSSKAVGIAASPTDFIWFGAAGTQ